MLVCLAANSDSIKGWKTSFSLLACNCSTQCLMCQLWLCLPHLNPAGAISDYTYTPSPPVCVWVCVCVCTWVQFVARRHAACGDFHNFLSLSFPLSHTHSFSLWHPALFLIVSRPQRSHVFVVKMIMQRRKKTHTHIFAHWLWATSLSFFICIN